MGFIRGGDSSPIILSLWNDKMQGNKSVQVEVGGPSGQGCNCGNFFFYDQNIEFESSQYRYVHVWVKPVAGCQWLAFHVWDVTHGDWKTMNGSKDGDVLYEVGEDLVNGQWNEVWLDLNQNNKGWANSRVRTFDIHANTYSTWRFDGIYTVSQPWQTFYYHCDYLGSPRLMTDAAGNVVWKQDYTAFGSDYGGSATGNTHKFTGHIQDATTRQYYAKARYFTTTLGRWSQPEPLLAGVPPTGFLRIPQMLNPYVYCRNNPLHYTDPTGMLDKETGYMTPEEEEMAAKAKAADKKEETLEPQNTEEAALMALQETQKGNNCLTVASLMLLAVNPPLGATALTATTISSGTISAAQGVIQRDPIKVGIAFGATAIGLGVAGNVTVKAAGLAPVKYNWGANRYINAFGSSRFVKTSIGTASMILANIANVMAQDLSMRSASNINFNTNGTTAAPVQLSPKLSGGGLQLYP